MAVWIFSAAEKWLYLHAVPHITKKPKLKTHQISFYHGSRKKKKNTRTQSTNGMKRMEKKRRKKQKIFFWHKIRFATLLDDWCPQKREVASQQPKSLLSKNQLTKRFTNEFCRRFGIVCVCVFGWKELGSLVMIYERVLKLDNICVISRILNRICFFMHNPFAHSKDIPALACQTLLSTVLSKLKIYWINKLVDLLAANIRISYVACILATWLIHFASFEFLSVKSIGQVRAKRTNERPNRIYHERSADWQFQSDVFALIFRRNVGCWLLAKITFNCLLSQYFS